MIQAPIVLDDIRKDSGRVIASTNSASLLDLGDGVLCLEFHSKGNTLDGNTLSVAEHAFSIIPGSYRGLVVGNQGRQFSFGANLRWLLSLLDEIGGDRARFHTIAKRFQGVTTGMRTTPFPVVSAPFDLTVGGALELTMYAGAVQAHERMRASLPEVAVGILPDLGGTSELYARCVEEAGENVGAGLAKAFQTIVYAKWSTDAESARELCFLSESDRVSTELATLLDEAKARVLELAPEYQTRSHRTGIPVLGEEGFAMLDRGIEAACSSGSASEYDAHIARAIARVMTGGAGPARTVDHQELLDLETTWFETLIFDPRTRVRMEHMLEHGTPMRN